MFVLSQEYLEKSLKYNRKYKWKYINYVILPYISSKRWILIRNLFIKTMWSSSQLIQRIFFILGKEGCIKIWNMK